MPSSAICVPGELDALRELRLDPRPLGCERVLPVRLEQRREALDELVRVVEDQRSGAP